MADRPAPTKENIQNEMISYISKEMDTNPSNIGASTRLNDLGFCSILAVQLIAHLKGTFNIEADSTSLSAHTVGELAAALATPA